MSGRQWGLVAGLVPVLLFITAPQASAHPTLLSTTPAAGYSVASRPSAITMVFDEPVSVAPHGVRVEDSSGHAVDTSEVAIEQGGRRVAVNTLEPMPAGRYVVHWEVTAQDGDVVAADFDFVVAAAAVELSGAESGSSTGFPVIAVLRWLFFLGLIGLLGGAVGERIVRRAVPAATRPRSLVRPSAAVGSLATASQLVYVVIATAGFGRAGFLLAVGAAGLALLAALAHRMRWWMVATVAVVVISVEALRNHLGSQRGVSGALVIAVHLVALSVWLGALFHLLRVARANRGGGVPIRRAFAVYSRLAVVLFLGVAVSGGIGALMLVPSPGVISGTAYGRTLLAKVSLVAVVAVLAWVARRRLLSATGSSFTRPVRAEAVVLLVVLAASAVLVSLPSPAPATADLGYPTPAVGPVIRLGGLAGQIAVGVAASENQLEVRLHTPDGDTATNDTRPPAFDLTAKLSGRGETVVLRPCGRGCFVGPVAWTAGLEHIELRVGATGWHGGMVSFPIRWAPHISRDALPRVRTAMLAQHDFRVVESITSDTTAPTPAAQSVIIDGPEFIDSDPYAGPPDPDVVVEPRPGGHRLLTFGLPAEGIHVELEVDASYRIVRETLADPNHLATRTFTYRR
ncbi:copper resistance protein CopC [Kribbella sp. NPDC050281]|uniref:copper resistance CopC/CopD family protein n=1 Tax=Kribbella sp. NPDC050281 TaxID=3155515 RepID=UPI00340D32FD